MSARVLAAGVNSATKYDVGLVVVVLDCIITTAAPAIWRRQVNVYKYIRTIIHSHKTWCKIRTYIRLVFLLNWKVKTRKKSKKLENNEKTNGSIQKIFLRLLQKLLPSIKQVHLAFVASMPDRIFLKVFSFSSLESTPSWLWSLCCPTCSSSPTPFTSPTWLRMWRSSKMQSPTRGSKPPWLLLKVGYDVQLRDWVVAF